QHIKRDKATSNICTAQVLLAVMAGMYSVFHGPEGLRKIASNIHSFTSILARKLTEVGCEITSEHFFDTIEVKVKEEYLEKIIGKSQQEEMNFRKTGSNTLAISIDETTEKEDIVQIVEVFDKIYNSRNTDVKFEKTTTLEEDFLRTDAILDHPVFNSYHSETEMMRYIKRLENKDLSLNHSMIPLGSCTMKLNATAEMIPVTWPEFGSLHPFVPRDQAEGYYEMINQLGDWLVNITGYDNISMQPNSGAQGEYAGMVAIRKYHESRGEGHRNICLIPVSAHGTNPATAAMTSYDVVLVECDKRGNIDMNDLKAKAAEVGDRLAAIMVTYPSTHGVFEESIRELCDVIHSYGGQVYMDGANMNAQVGLTAPGFIGSDVSH